MNNKKIEYEIIKNIGTLKNGRYTKEINFISWNGNKPVYDIRNYNVDGNGTKKALKGISLSLEEIRMLKEILENLDMEEF